MQYVATDEQAADPLTKFLPAAKQPYARNLMGMGDYQEESLPKPPIQIRSCIIRSHLQFARAAEELGDISSNRRAIEDADMIGGGAGSSSRS